MATTIRSPLPDSGVSAGASRTPLVSSRALGVGLHAAAADPGLIAIHPIRLRVSVKPHLVFVDSAVGSGQPRRGFAADPPLPAGLDVPKSSTSERGVRL